MARYIIRRDGQEVAALECGIEEAGPVARELAVRLGAKLTLHRASDGVKMSTSAPRGMKLSNDDMKLPGERRYQGSRRWAKLA